ncbi:MAG: hypothetical protein AB1331_08490 [Bacillota bacterium]
MRNLSGHDIGRAMAVIRQFSIIILVAACILALIDTILAPSPVGVLVLVLLILSLLAVIPPRHYF